MSKLNDKEIDKIIKEKFSQDDVIPDKVNSIFDNFIPQMKANKANETNKEKKSNISEFKPLGSEQFNTTNQASTNKKVTDMMFYKKLNRILSVAAVSLSVVLVGGTALYFNKDNLIKGGNPNTANNVTVSKSYLIKNEEMHYSNEQITKEVEYSFVKAYIFGNREVGVAFQSSYWDSDLREQVTLPGETYKVDGIYSDVKDIFLGETGMSGVPYIFLVMTDGTASYVDLHGRDYNTFYFNALPILGLTDVVGFEQRTRNFSYSRSEYTYVNAIKSDGQRKEVEIGEVNDWNDITTKTFDKYNAKYIKTHNGEPFDDDYKGDYEVDNIDYVTVNGSKYVYFRKSNALWRMDRTTGEKECIAYGINGMVRNNPDGRISYYVMENNYSIFKLDDNIVYRRRDESVINETSSSFNSTVNNTTNNAVNSTTNNTVNNTTNNVVNNTVNNTTNNAVNNTTNNTTNNTVSNVTNNTTNNTANNVTNNTTNNTANNVTNNTTNTSVNNTTDNKTNNTTINNKVNNTPYSESNNTKKNESKTSN